MQERDAGLLGSDGAGQGTVCEVRRGEGGLCVSRGRYFSRTGPAHGPAGAGPMESGPAVWARPASGPGVGPAAAESRGRSLSLLPETESLFREGLRSKWMYQRRVLSRA